MVGSFLVFNIVFTPFGTFQGYFYMHLSVAVIHLSVPVIILLVPTTFLSIYSRDLTLSLSIEWKLKENWHMLDYWWLSIFLVTDKRLFIFHCLYFAIVSLSLLCYCILWRVTGNKQFIFSAVSEVQSTTLKKNKEQ